LDSRRTANDSYPAFMSTAAILFAVIGILFAVVQVVMAHARTRPRDAVSSLSEWAEFYRLPKIPTWLRNENADVFALKWGRIVTLLAIPGMIISGAIWWSQSGAVAPVPTRTHVLSSNELEKLKEIDEFIGDKQEYELRSIFDLDNMFYNNLGMARDALLHYEGPPTKYSSFFDGGQSFLDLRYMKREPDSEGKINYKCMAPAMCSINQSKKYVENFNKLEAYGHSVFVPESVRATVLAFADVVNKDKEYMSDIINYVAAADRESIMDFDNVKSPRLGGAVSTYSMRTQNLRGAADRVTSSISSLIKDGALSN
jgi:hypothetical protein